MHFAPELIFTIHFHTKILFFSFLFSLSYQNSENVIGAVGSIWTEASVISEMTGEGVLVYHYMLKKQKVANKHRKVANNL